MYMPCNFKVMRGFFIVSLLLFVSMLSISGCTSNAAITAVDKKAIDAGQMTIVLIRVVASVQKQVYEPFSEKLVDDNLCFGIGSINTAGQLKRVQNAPLFFSGKRRQEDRLSQYFLSPKSRRDGWTFLVLAPGTYYFTVQPPRSGSLDNYMKRFEKPPSWYFDVPENTSLIYAGTLHIKGSEDKLIFGSGLRMREIIGTPTVDSEDSTSAMQLFSQYFPTLGSMQVSLLKPYEGGPLIFRTPLPKKNDD